MASIDGNSFELERRLIQLKYNTNMPAAVGGGVLGFDNDPNTAVNGATSGQTLIYNVALGASFLQSNGTLWYKQELPNKEENLLPQGMSEQQLAAINNLKSMLTKEQNASTYLWYIIS